MTLIWKRNKESGVYVSSCGQWEIHPSGRQFALCPPDDGSGQRGFVGTLRECKQEAQRQINESAIASTVQDGTVARLWDKEEVRQSGGRPTILCRDDVNETVLKVPSSDAAQQEAVR